MAIPNSEHLDFQVKRSDWSETRFVPGTAPSEPSTGQVLFRVNRFAFTANNISYAKAGDMLRYWDFFPAEEGWGRLPTMGFAEVIASAHPEVQEGERVFGFFPMSRYLVIEPRNVGNGQMADGVAHREGLAPAYNSYNLARENPYYDPAREDEYMLMWGLFFTSFLVDDFVGESDLFGAKRIVITSASSKTSIALAYLASQAGRAEVIGLTSARNAAFVKGLGFYDQVIQYDDVESIAADSPAVIVDMAGNGEVINRFNRHLGENVKYSCAVGATHWEASPVAKDLPGAKPEFFFAPGQMVKRSKEWGPGELQRRMGEAWGGFVDASESWLKVHRSFGREDVERVYRETLNGQTSPDEGQILSLWEESD